jgi:Dolichyl-phosphate-mannose-protein mannosyltransferase
VSSGADRAHTRDSGPTSAALRRIGTPLGIFAASRAAIFAVLFFATRLPGAGKAPRFLTAWDGGWYLLIARKGYPKSLVAAPGQSDHAFFPLYPLLIRGVHALAGGSLDRAAVGVTLVASGAAMVAVWLLVERLTDTATATRSIAFMSFFPWAFIFSFAYSEGLLLALAGICLLALLDERWLVAGIAAGLAGAARPNGFVLALPCAWAALAAIRSRRQWAALAAPVLAPLGILGFFLFLRLRTGDFLANLHARSRGWAYDGIGFFHHPTPGSVLSSFLAHPFLDIDKLVSFLSIGFILVALAMMLAWRPPGPTSCPSSCWPSGSTPTCPWRASP